MSHPLENICDVIIHVSKPELCELYPLLEKETCVCDGGSDVSGGPPCTRDMQGSCEAWQEWAEEEEDMDDEMENESEMEERELIDDEED